jgi:hypothetical protein|tara:strand:+ start:2636 stop:3040 length:405 start_codon:yes stop_codon:yes gene_type:complete
METSKLKELSETYGLVGSDIHVQSYGQKKIYFMKKSGIDKIQAIEQIEIDFDPIDALCVPGLNVAFKVHAKWGNKLPYRTVGEANKDNSKVNYLACMAENRGRARAVLNLTGFANEGVYSAEDKWEADELNHSK